MGLEDLDGRCEIVVFPELFATSIELLKKDACLFIQGKANAREDVAKILAEDIMPLEDVKKRRIDVITIDLRMAGLSMELLEQLKEILASFPCWTT